MEHPTNSIRINLGVKVFISFLLTLLPFQMARATLTAGEELIMSLRNNVVSIIAERSDGTQHYGFGFIVGTRNEELFIVTANHVVRDEIPIPGVTTTQVEVKFFSNQGRRYNATLLETSDSTYDLAVLQVKSPKGLIWLRKSLGPQSLVNRGTPVWFIGRQAKWYVPTQPGLINHVGLDSKVSIDNLQVRVGTSGAPLITEKGIIGMVRADEGGGTVEAIPISIIERAIQNWNLPWNLTRSTPKPQKTTRRQPVVKKPSAVKPNTPTKPESSDVKPNTSTKPVPRGEAPIKRLFGILKKPFRATPPSAGAPVKPVNPPTPAELCPTLSTGNKDIKLKVWSRGSVDYIKSGQCINLQPGNYGIAEEAKEVACKTVKATLRSEEKRSIELACTLVKLAKLCPTLSTGNKGIKLKVWSRRSVDYIESGQCLDLEPGVYGIAEDSTEIACKRVKQVLQAGQTHSVRLVCALPKK